jgi:hypothetical protein
MMLFHILVVLFNVLNALNNGVGVTPALGFNTWNKFACRLTEDVIKDTAQQIVSLKLKDVGYVYVNVCSFVFFFHMFLQSWMIVGKCLEIQTRLLLPGPIFQAGFLHFQNMCMIWD